VLNSRVSAVLLICALPRS